MIVKRWMLLLALLLPLLAACGNTQESGSGTNAPGGQVAATAAPADSAGQASAGGDLEVDASKLASELYFYNWSEYIDPVLLEEFEAEYGVRVILDTYPANEEMLGKLRAGNSGYDLVVPSDYAVQIMAAEELALPLDKSLLPNLTYVDPGLLDQFFDKGNVYSVPYMYGISGIAYNKQVFADLGLPAPDSWSALFDPAQLELYEQNELQFSMLDDERETPGAALRYLGKSVNETDPAVLAQVTEILTAQKASPAMSYNSESVNKRLAGEENFVIAHAWSGMAMQARNGLGEEFSGNPNIEFVMPKEGGVIWMDNFVIPADAPNAYTAHVLINFLLRPDVAARNTEYIGYLTPNGEAVPLLSQEIKDLYAQGFAPDEAMYERLEWIERTEATAAFTDLWTVVKGE